MASTPMRVTMMIVSCGNHSHKIDRKSDRTDDEQLTRIHFGRIHQALDRLKYDENRY